MPGPRREAQTQVIAGAAAPERRLPMALRPDLRPCQGPERLLSLADRLHVQVPVEPDRRARPPPVGKQIRTGRLGPTPRLRLRLPKRCRDLGAIPGGREPPAPALVSSRSVTGRRAISAASCCRIHLAILPPELLAQSIRVPDCCFSIPRSFLAPLLNELVLTSYTRGGQFPSNEEIRSDSGRALVPVRRGRGSAGSEVSVGVAGMGRGVGPGFAGRTPVYRTAQLSATANPLAELDLRPVVLEQVGTCTASCSMR